MDPFARFGFQTKREDLPIDANGGKVKDLSVPIRTLLDYFDYLYEVKYGPQKLPQLSVKVKNITISIVKPRPLFLDKPTLLFSPKWDRILWTDKSFMNEDTLIMVEGFFRTEKNEYKISEMTRGWCIGNFIPAVYRTTDFELGILSHKAGERWPFHIHDQIEEYNYLFKGKMLINGIVFSAGETFYFPKGHLACPLFLEDCIIVCVKVPSIPTDKRII